MISTIYKEKIPKKYSFCLQTKQLEEIIKNNGININTNLKYQFYNKELNILFDACFHTPNENVEYNRLFINIGAVPNTSIQSVRKSMKDVILPEFIVWITNILSLPCDSPMLIDGLRFSASIEKQALQIKQYKS